MSSAALPLQDASARGMLLPQRLALFAGVTLVCCGAAAGGLLRGAAVLPLALAAIAVAMWHGAYDQVQAEQVLARPFGQRWLPMFLTGYVVLAGLTLAGWRLAPFASLVLFLLYASWHFGTEAEQRMPSLPGATVALAMGAVPIVAACWWHGDAVTPIFAQMAGRQGALTDGLTHALAVGCWPVLATALIGIALGQLGRGRAQKVELLAVLVLQVALFAMCDPLVAFAVYFCCWHSPEHLVATSVAPASLGQNLKAGLVPWLLSMVLLAALFTLGRHEAVAYRAEIFILLSALTVPHMALNELRRTQFARGKGSR